MKRKGFNRKHIVIILLVYLATQLYIQGKHSHLLIGAENDWQVYKNLAKSFATVFSWNGFNTMGYPFLIRVFTPLFGNTFDAGRFAVSIGGLILLLAVFYLCTVFVREKTALIITLLWNLNWFFLVRTTLLAGTDIWWAAMTIWSLYFIARYIRRDSITCAILAGTFAGLSYLFRYTGTILPLSLVAIYIIALILRKPEKRFNRGLLFFLLAFLITGSPQIHLNWKYGGSPFASYHAKNLWFGVHGELNWAEKWEQVEDDISVGEVISESPVKFVTHWIKQCIKSVGRLVLMSANVDYRLAVYVFKRLFLAIQLILFFAALGLLFAKVPLRKNLTDFIRKSKAFLLIFFVYLFFYLVVTSAVFSMYRLFIPFIPIFYIIIARAIDNTRFKKTGVTVLLICFSFGLYNNSDAFFRETEFPVERIRAEIDRPGKILLYGPYSHLQRYVDQPVVTIKTNLSPNQLKAKADSINAQYIILQTPVFYRSGTPDQFPEDLSKITNYTVKDSIVELRRTYLLERR